ncbi:MAG: iron-sulfur cluster assembly scaffold protein [Candidatus Pelagibacter sp.]|nr:iron-sulfur cluster assembly scaffold protein [Candidatus Pelagibacter sp.]|tara:strand:- start:138 stop:536 length:399 start_codon:yes stop_codon:yes gene_type:complete
MLTNKIIKLAHNTKNYGLKDNFTHKISLKNKRCGDKITIELIVIKGKINSMRYEMQSCVYSQASASLFSNKIKNFNRKDIIDLDTLLKKSFKENVRFLKKHKFLKQLFNIDNFKRSDCILLPFNAIIKAFDK